MLTRAKVAASTTKKFWWIYAIFVFGWITVLYFFLTTAHFVKF